MNLHELDPFSTTWSDLEAIVGSPAAIENQYVEYKRQFPQLQEDQESARRRRDQQLSFIQSISSFANASGGLFIVGVKAKDGIPNDLVGIPVGKLDTEENTLRQLLANHVTPRIPSMRSRIVTSPNGERAIFVLHVPSSPRRPHMVRWNVHRFYGRDGNGKTVLDVEELRELFVKTGRESVLAALAFELDMNAARSNTVGYYPVPFDHVAMDLARPYLPDLPQLICDLVVDAAQYVAQMNGIVSVQAMDGSDANTKRDRAKDVGAVARPVFRQAAASIRRHLSGADAIASDPC